jgi:hypothetical protein
MGEVSGIREYGGKKLKVSREFTRDRLLLGSAIPTKFALSGDPEAGQFEERY